MRLLVGLVVLLCVDISFIVAFQSGVSFSREFLLQMSKMPKFTKEDEEELARILGDGENLFQKNVPKSKANSIPASKPPPAPSVARVHEHVKPILKPNDDWRAAMNSPAYYNRDTIGKATYSANQAANAKKPVVIEEDPFEMDFDYDDMESALREEMMMANSGGGGIGIKHSKVIKEHDGLKSGDVVPPYAWTWLKDTEGVASEFHKIHKNSSDTVVLVADPRRMNDEFLECIRQLNKVPRSALQVEMVVVNCDDPNDMRKFMKKNANNGASQVLCDGSKRFMDVLKCRTSSRLTASLIVLDVSSSKIIRVWYESDWDAFTTRDLIVEELKLYRKNPVAYIQSQIGIR